MFALLFVQVKAAQDLGIKEHHSFVPSLMLLLNSLGIGGGAKGSLLKSVGPCMPHKGGTLSHVILYRYQIAWSLQATESSGGTWAQCKHGAILYWCNGRGGDNSANALPPLLLT